MPNLNLRRQFVSSIAKTGLNIRAQLGLKALFADLISYTPAVVILDENKKINKELIGPKEKSQYEAALEKTLKAK